MPGSPAPQPSYNIMLCTFSSIFQHTVQQTIAGNVKKLKKSQNSVLILYNNVSNKKIVYITSSKTAIERNHEFFYFITDMMIKYLQY